MKNMSRAIRRHHRARLIKKALTYWVVDFYNNSEPNNSITINRAVRYHNHLAICSCWGCCNERSNPWLCAEDRLTFAERRNKDSFHDQLKEVDIYGYLVDNTEDIWPDDDK